MAFYYHFLRRTVGDDGVVTAHFRPSMHAQGAWNADEQHMGAASGLIVHEIEQFMPRSDLRIGRISYDIWGKIDLCDFSITTRLIRPGKTIELIEACLTVNNKTCIVARAWRMVTSNTEAIAGIEDKPVHSPEQCEPWPQHLSWGGGFIQSLEGRSALSNRQGKGLIWLNTPVSWLEDEPTSDFVHLIGLVDMANGTAPRQARPFSYAFPNLDLQLHILRLPKGRWLGLEACQQYGDDGIGITSAILHDIYGPFGRSEQILTLRPIIS